MIQKVVPNHVQLDFTHPSTYKISLYINTTFKYQGASKIRSIMNRPSQPKVVPSKPNHKSLDHMTWSRQFNGC